MKILFHFGDNDFGNTFRQVFKLLQLKCENNAAMGTQSQIENKKRKM